MKKSNNTDDCCGCTGPTTEPIDLRSDDMTLRDQSSPTRDGSNPKEDAMLQMISDRVKTKFDPMGGMPNDNERSRSFE